NLDYRTLPSQLRPHRRFRLLIRPEHSTEPTAPHRILQRSRQPAADTGRASATRTGRGRGAAETAGASATGRHDPANPPGEPTADKSTTRGGAGLRRRISRGPGQGGHVPASYRQTVESHRKG